MKKIVISSLLIFGAFAGGCSPPDSVQENSVTNESEELQDFDTVYAEASDNAQEALDVLLQSVEAANANDLEGYLDTIAEEFRDRDRETLEPAFESGTPHTTIRGVKILSESDEEIVIAMKQHSVDEEENIDTTGTLRHTFTKEDGEYKITHSES